MSGTLVSAGVSDDGKVAWQLYLVTTTYGRFRLASRRLPDGEWKTKTVEVR